MSYPTGMSAATGNHYNDVAARMQAYLHGNTEQNLYSAHGQRHYHNPTQGVAYASRAMSMGAHQSGIIDPVIANDIGGFARLFMKNLLR